MIVDQNEKATMRRTQFLSLTEEIQSHILSLLPWRDILRCTSVCKTLRQTYISSSELQYIVELGGQHLLPVPDTDFKDQTCISKRLELLRRKAHSWRKFDIHSFETISIPEQFGYARIFLADGHICLWDEGEDSAKIFPVLPKASQQAIKRDWSPGSLCSVPNARCADVYMDPTQNLIAAAYPIANDMLQWSNEMFDHMGTQEGYIDIGALDGNGTGMHPKAAGRTLSLSQLEGHENSNVVSLSWMLEGLGRHIALQRSLLVSDVGSTSFKEIWWLQIWDWQQSTRSSSILTHALLGSGDSIDFCFLGNDRLLIISDLLKLYSIEDLSQPPQLLACFSLPIESVMGIQSMLPIDDVAHNSQPQMQTQQTMWTSDPEHRLLSLLMFPPSLVFIVSTNIFFNLDLFKGITGPIPWENWGPLNTRVFLQPWRCNVAISGNRVLRAFPANDATVDGILGPTEYRLHMMDFSPSAIKHWQKGSGCVMKEPSTIMIGKEAVTSSLPYVEVISDRRFSMFELVQIWADKDRIYLPKVLNMDFVGALNFYNEIEVIEM